MLKRSRCVQICHKAVVFHRERLLYSMKTTAPEMIVSWIRTGAKPFTSWAVDERLRCTRGFKKKSCRTRLSQLGTISRAPYALTT